MKQSDVKAFLTELGGRVTSSHSEWVTSTCVFAPWLHDGGVDKNPSSGMTVNANGESHYNCFSCDSRGAPDTVFNEVKYLNKREPKIDINIKFILTLVSRESEPNLDFDLDLYEEQQAGKALCVPFDVDWYNGFATASNHPYLTERGVSAETAKELNIRVDLFRRRMLFPIYDWWGVFMGVHGRTFAGEMPRYMSYSNRANHEGHRNPSVWMGENHTDIGGPIILCEGQFDYAKVYPFYENVLSGQTTQVSEAKLNRIAGASSIITMYDNGVGGDKGRKRIDKFFKGTPVQHIEIPEKYGDLGNCPDSVVYKLLTLID